MSRTARSHRHNRGSNNKDDRTKSSRAKGKTCKWEKQDKLSKQHKNKKKKKKRFKHNRTASLGEASSKSEESDTNQEISEEQENTDSWDFGENLTRTDLEFNSAAENSAFRSSTSPAQSSPKPFHTVDDDHSERTSTPERTTEAQFFSNYQQTPISACTDSLGFSDEEQEEGRSDEPKTVDDPNRFIDLAHPNPFKALEEDNHFDADSESEDGEDQESEVEEAADEDRHSSYSSTSTTDYSDTEALASEDEAAVSISTSNDSSSATSDVDWRDSEPGAYQASDSEAEAHNQQISGSEIEARSNQSFDPETEAEDSEPEHLEPEDLEARDSEAEESSSSSIEEETFPPPCSHTESNRSTSDYEGINRRDSSSYTDYDNESIREGETEAEADSYSNDERQISSPPSPPASSAPPLSPIPSNFDLDNNVQEESLGSGSDIEDQIQTEESETSESDREEDDSPAEQYTEEDLRIPNGSVEDTSLLDTADTVSEDGNYPDLPYGKPDFEVDESPVSEYTSDDDDDDDVIDTQPSHNFPDFDSENTADREAGCQEENYSPTENQFFEQDSNDTAPNSFDSPVPEASEYDEQENSYFPAPFSAYSEGSHEQDRRTSTVSSVPELQVPEEPLSESELYSSINIEASRSPTLSNRQSRHSFGSRYPQSIENDPEDQQEASDLDLPQTPRSAAGEGLSSRFVTEPSTVSTADVPSEELHGSCQDIVETSSYPSAMAAYESGQQEGSVSGTTLVDGEEGNPPGEQVHPVGEQGHPIEEKISIFRRILQKINVYKSKGHGREHAENELYRFFRAPLGFLKEKGRKNHRQHTLRIIHRSATVLCLTLGLCNVIMAAFLCNYWRTELRDNGPNQAPAPEKFIWVPFVAFAFELMCSILDLIVQRDTRIRTWYWIGMSLLVFMYGWVGVSLVMTRYGDGHWILSGKSLSEIPAGYAFQAACDWFGVSTILLFAICDLLWLAELWHWIYWHYGTYIHAWFEPPKNTSSAESRV